MKEKFLIIALILFSNLKINAQQYSASGDEPMLTEALKNIRIEKDEFTHIAKYYSDRTPKDIKDQDRFFIFINVPANPKEQRLFLEVSHYASFHPNIGYMRYSKIILLADDKTIELPLSLGAISGNGNQHSTFTMGFGRRPEYYDFIKSMISAQTTKARLYTDDGRYLDFDISSRERKAINDVITLWEIVNK